jgi:G:T-mismatch repair DNA endonuclease (very short patch repair protein)
MYKYWTKKEKDFLRKNYLILSRKELEQHLKRNMRTIEAKAIAMSLEHRRHWKQSEIDWLIKNYSKVSTEDAMRILKRNSSTISAKARKLRIPNKRLWTNKQIQYLKNNYESESIEIISNYLGMKKANITAKANRLGLKRNRSSLEQSFEKFLLDNSIDFNKQVYFWKYIVDFVIGFFAIEIQGTFWHSDSRFYTIPEYKIQEENILRDLRKKDYLKKKNMYLIVVWEYDWNNDRNRVIKEIKAVLSGNGQDYNSAKSVKGEIPNTEVTEENKTVSVP